MKGIAILGSTGSIGRQTLEVISSFPQHFSVVALGGWRNMGLLREQAEEFRPALVCGKDLGSQAVLPGFGKAVSATMEEMVYHPKVDVVVVATAGPAALIPTLQALRARKAVALASKEVLVAAGAIIAKERAAGATLLPIDSEASAIWQCLQGEDDNVSRVIITASGGPFRTKPLAELATVTSEEALKHPTWRMGKKITVDSATLMNKAFEVIEAHLLFQVPWERIEVVLHPQSIVHSMVEFRDGSVKAQMAPPDMRLPLQYALFYPQRLPTPGLERLDIAKLGCLTFEALDLERYPCFSIGMQAAKTGGTYPAALCAADDVAVRLFLEGEAGFTDIPHLIQRVLDEHVSGSADSLEDVIAADAWARRRTLELARA
ncbi:MAG: 1-deoxy-D-xylulose-5-phosphate reductoisomerase [Chloroflexi bacterium]|nr:1-deoxy-D-xylulose-5-phosphate reductoisomerase [Chloroflexota bacterium]